MLHEPDSGLHWPAGDSKAVARPRPSDSLRHDQQPGTGILVVDPDGETRLMYRQALESAGHEVIEATDGRDALVKALNEPPRLVITETRLPIMDGYALCEILRRDYATRLLPILVVTSETRPDKLQEARRVGANAVLAKPAHVEVILDETRRLLGDGTGDTGSQSDSRVMTS